MSLYLDPTSAEIHRHPSRYPAAIDTTATVIIGAHYDSRGSFGSLRAPGGNDDGSGVIALLAIARVLNRRTRLRFHSNVELVAFAGEEQGLLGSKAYAC
jgi:Zn-dependent M28 family amino/carboxypeptidase